MKIILVIISLTLVYVSSIYGAILLGYSRVWDENLVKQGYSCESPKFGLMKDGEVNNNPSKKECISISCTGVLITYYTCVNVLDPCTGPGAYSKPYPECCFTKIC